jgi:hypothetical protein
MMGNLRNLYIAIFLEAEFQRQRLDTANPWLYGLNPRSTWMLMLLGVNPW